MSTSESELGSESPQPQPAARSRIAEFVDPLGAPLGDLAEDGDCTGESEVAVDGEVHAESSSVWSRTSGSGSIA